MNPTVLLVTTCNWVSAARLAIALSSAGFEVEGVCPPGHLLNKTSVVRRLYSYNVLFPLRSLSKALATVSPDLLVPCDDLATRHLHLMYKLSSGNGTSRVSRLIELSLGAPENFDLIEARTPLLQLAQQEGVAVPKSEVIKSVGELATWEEGTFPIVLKADGTSGGEGTGIVCTREDAERAFRALQAPPRFLRMLKWLLVNHDMRSVRSTILRKRSVVNAQTFVTGREATSLVACWNGCVLAELHFEVLCEEQKAGPASILRLIENPEMSTAAGKLARRLRLSGLHGFDFILENDTGRAYLIEMNPRTTQVGHLTFGPRRDLPAALYSAVTGKAPRISPRITENDIIVIFPAAWIRNSGNAFFKSGYHDIPTKEAELVRACLHRPSRLGSWLTNQRLIRALRGPRLPRL